MECATAGKLWLMLLQGAKVCLDCQVNEGVCSCINGDQCTLVAGLRRTKLIHEPQQFRLNELKTYSMSESHNINPPQVLNC